MPIACWIPKVTNTDSEYVIFILLFHGNNGCTNGPHCQAICTLSVLFALFQAVWYSGKFLDLYLKVPGLKLDQIIDYPL
jgi:hypothetical protein